MKISDRLTDKTRQTHFSDKLGKTLLYHLDLISEGKDTEAYSSYLDYARAQMPGREPTPREQWLSDGRAVIEMLEKTGELLQPSIN